jgi:hypothetical protein
VKRLGVEAIDLYYRHRDDDVTHGELEPLPVARGATPGGGRPPDGKSDGLVVHTVGLELARLHEEERIIRLRLPHELAEEVGADLRVEDPRGPSGTR